MKKFLKISSILFLAVFLLTGYAFADAFNTRPLTAPPATLFPPHSEQTLGGAGGIFDSIGAASYAADPVNTQSSAALFGPGGLGASITSFIIAIANNAPNNEVGLYKAGDTSIRAPIWDGANANPSVAGVAFLGDGSVAVGVFNGLPGVFDPNNFIVTGITPNFGSTFGFYLDGPGGLFFTEDSENPNGDPQALVYQGNNTDTITIPGFAAGLFGDQEWIIAFEDVQYANADKDFNDFVFAAESIVAVPEPATMLLSGLGLLGLGAFLRRRFKKA